MVVAALVMEARYAYRPARGMGVPSPRRPVLPIEQSKDTTGCGTVKEVGIAN
jgi:hypothetical protein